MDTDQLREESIPADIPGLVAQARSAYQQNRIKECLALTRAALLVDPGNTAAIELQSAVRFDMQRDLSDARALIEESRNKPEAAKYRKAAEIILRKALYLDPDSEGARTLLSSIRTSTDTPSAPASTERAYAPPVFVPVTPAPQAHPEMPAAAGSRSTESASYTSVMVEEPPVEYATPAVLESPAGIASNVEPMETVAPILFEGMAAARTESNGSAYGSSYVTQPEVREAEPIPFTTGTTFVERDDAKKGKKTSLTLPIVIVSIAVLAGGFLLFQQRMNLVQAAAPTTTTTAAAIPDSSSNEQAVSSTKLTSNAPASIPATSPRLATNANVPANSPNSSINTAKAATPVLAALNAPTSPAASASASSPAANSRPASGTATGSVAISSAIAAEIYIADKYMGSTPTTLQLPAGSQTLEFRHGDLRATVTHVVKASETTTAVVTFDVMVQVNARPWANVFVEGTPRLPLGQTPLSDVRLPIGSVLIFENPNFPSKSHKIAVDDKTIQVAFQ